MCPNGDNYGAQLGEPCTIFPALYHAPCRFLSPTAPMAHYQNLPRDEHELSPSPAPAGSDTPRSDTPNDPYDPWNHGVIDVSARPRRVFFFFFFILTKVPCIDIFSCVTRSTTMRNLFSPTHLRISFLRVQCMHRKWRNRKREKGE